MDGYIYQPFQLINRTSNQEPSAPVLYAMSQKQLNFLSHGQYCKPAPVPHIPQRRIIGRGSQGCPVMGLDPSPIDGAPKEEPVAIFEAYRSEVVVEQFPRKIQSLCIWGDQVLAGLQDGSLLFFRNVPVDVSSGRTSWQVRSLARAHG